MFGTLQTLVKNHIQYTYIYVYLLPSVKYLLKILAFNFIYNKHHSRFEIFAKSLPLYSFIHFSKLLYICIYMNIL